MIAFPWLVAIVLGEPAQRVGIAQMAVMAPAMLFMLYGGAVADRADCRRLLLRYQAMATLPPLALAGCIMAGGPRDFVLIAYGLPLGTPTPLLIPTPHPLLPPSAIH